MTKKVRGEQVSEKFHIHTTISKKTKDLLEKYKDAQDESGKFLFGSKSRVIEQALELLENYYNPKENDVNTIWCRTRDELNMVLVGKTTFLSYIKGKKRDAYKNNIALEIIEWYLGKQVDKMSFEEFLKGLIGVWYMANYFYNIEFNKNDDGAFQIRFNHDLNKEYSDYWAGYFELLLKSNWSCEVDSFIRNESFYLIIKEI